MERIADLEASELEYLLGMTSDDPAQFDLAAELIVPHFPESG
ncbi:MAG: hypothetical protein OXG37_07205 [Actinomycetia bacterium]|nr:hypothetical protein [Actinomycetes bacterium]